jgi:hypothetical protein
MKPNTYLLNNKVKFALMAAIFALDVTNMASALTITQTTTSATLATALGGGGGLTITSATVMNGATGQFGTYTGFTSPPVSIGNGVVMSTGLVTQSTAAFASPGSSPSSDMGWAGTSEFDAYGPGHITNFVKSYDAASLQVSFTLAAASQVGFSFIFGSVEYPVYVNSYSDAFLAFLDGTATANQIVFDTSNNAVQVGTTFAGSLTTGDTNTSFTKPHGLLALTTFTTGALTAGAHTLTFEIADVNDHVLDSGVFITNLHAGTGGGGTNPSVPDVGTTASLLGLAMLGMAGLRRKLKLA